MRELPDGRVLEDSGDVRDYVKTDATREFAAPAARRYVAMGRERIRAVREGAEAACPACRLLGIGANGLTVRCAIERSLVTEHENPNALGRYCLSLEGYVTCPTWREEKERLWAQKGELVPEEEGV